MIAAHLRTGKRGSPKIGYVAAKWRRQPPADPTLRQPKTERGRTYVFITTVDPITTVKTSTSFSQ